MTTPDDDLETDVLEEDDDLDFADADAFFAAEVSPIQPAVLRLYGEEYELPTRIPLAYAMLVERRSEDTSLEAIREVLTPVFGEDALDHWMRQGMDDRQFGIVLLWSARNMDKPGSMSFAEAARHYDAQAAGKAPAPNRAARRAASKRGRSGGRS